MKSVTPEQRHELHRPDKSKVKCYIQKEATTTDEPMLWDSLESDTESLVQEKAYQRELQKRLARDSGLLSAEIFKQKSDREGSKYSEEQPHDGLQAKRQQTTESHRPMRQTAPEDEYDDLRYDPNWRENLEGVQFLNQINARLSLDSFEESEDSLEPLEDFGQRQEYIVVSNQPALEMDAGLFPQPSSPFHLHSPQETSAQYDVLDPTELKPSSMSCEKTTRSDGKHQNMKQRTVAYQHPSNLNAQVKAQEDIVERNKTTLGINAHKQGSYLKAHRQRDKVDDKKPPRQTSCETISTRSPESRDNIRDPELMWLQKTQKLKQSHKERKDPKKRERTNNHSDQLKPQVPEAKPRPGAYLKPLTERRVISADHLLQAHTEDHVFPGAPDAYSYSHDPPQHHPPHSNAAPTVNLNINLHSSANHAQPHHLHLTQQETIFTLVSQALQWERPDLFNTSLLQPGYLFPPNAVRQMGLAPPAAVSSPGSDSGVVQGKNGVVQRHAGKPLLNAFENASFKNHHRIRIPVLKLPTSPQAEASHYPPEFMSADDGSSVLRIQTSGAYTVLPPIGPSNASDTELCSDRSEQQLNPIHRSSSEGYLSQLERHRQLKAKTNYKTYTLKDYKNLRQEVKLGGLGPTNTIPEAVAEKIRQQKLYSNVIREQNKKISRIPSLPAKDPVGSDNKDAVPRRKALEYAKTITKPKAPPKTNDRPREKNPSHPQQMDPVQLATLEMLKRHKEEKQAVARFRTIHAI